MKPHNAIQIYCRAATVSEARPMIVFHSRHCYVYIYIYIYVRNANSDGRNGQTMQTSAAVGTYKGEPGGAKCYNIKSTPNPDPKTNTKSTQSILAQFGSPLYVP